MNMTANLDATVTIVLPEKVAQTLLAVAQWDSVILANAITEKTGKREVSTDNLIAFLQACKTQLREPVNRIKAAREILENGVHLQGVPVP